MYGIATERTSYSQIHDDTQKVEAKNVSKKE
jgi:hypothetical protein